MGSLRRERKFHFAIFPSSLVGIFLLDERARARELLNLVPT